MADGVFKGRHFAPQLSLLCVRWSCRYGVSYRDLEQMMAERGVIVDHSTIYRWVQRYAPEVEKQLRSEHDVSLPHEADVEQACAVICRTLETLDGPEREPPPEAIPWELAGSTVSIRVRWWSSSQRASVVHARGQVIAAIQRELTGGGMGRPSPANAVLPRDQAGAPSSTRARQDAAPMHAGSSAASDR